MSLNGFQSVLRALRWLPMLPALAIALILDAPGNPAAAAGEPDVLAAVQERGYVRCGVHRSGVGLAEIRADGVWAGYFVEFCRVVALAVVGDSNAIRVYEVDDLSAGLALADELVDVVLSTIRPLDAAAEPGIAYLSPILEDEQLLVSFRGGIAGVDDLPPSARICASGHPTAQANLQRALGERGSSVEVRSYASIDGIFNAFFRHRCDALSHHHYAILAQSLLRSPQRSPIWRSEFGLGRVAFAPSVRSDDPQWMAVVDAAVRSALHDPDVDPQSIASAVRAGFAARIQVISNSRSAIYDRTLGHMGGQGFYPASPDPAANGS
jgi:general L-amino acid transport system substrate-binding protein